MLSKISRTLLFLLVIFVLVGCGTGTETPTPDLSTSTPVPSPTMTPVPAAVTINGEVVSLAEFEAELVRYKAAQTALNKPVTDEQAKQTVLDDMIAQVLLSQGAAENGFTVDDATLQARIDALASQVGGTDALAKWQADNGYTPDDFKISMRRAIAAAWMRDQIISQVPTSADQVHVKQILFYNEERARQVQADMLAGRTDFDEFAALVDPLAHGDLGWFPRDYIAEKDVESMAFSLPPDQVSDVIPTELGFHVIKVLAREKRTLSPDALLALQDNALREWVEQQKTQSKIVIAP